MPGYNLPDDVDITNDEFNGEIYEHYHLDDDDYDPDEDDWDDDVWDED